MSYFLTCTHTLHRVGRLGVIACSACGEVAFVGPMGPLDPAEGMAALFGDYNLVATLPAVGAPGPEVLMYRAPWPPPARAAQGLSAFPAHHWLEAAPGLWLSHDHHHLLLSPTDPLLRRNLTRGA